MSSIALVLCCKYSFEAQGGWGGGGGGTLIFSYIQARVIICVQNFEFQYFLGVSSDKIIFFGV